MKKKRKQPLHSKAELVAGILACLLMGTVFVFGNAYWMKEITWEETVYEKLIYTSHQVPIRHKKSITLNFSDHESMTIHGSLRTDALEAALEDIRPGTQVGVYGHPNSNYIMDLTANGKKLLSFEAVQQILNVQRIGFQALGAIMYTFAGLFIFALLKYRK